MLPISSSTETALTESIRRFTSGLTVVWRTNSTDPSLTYGASGYNRDGDPAAMRPPTWYADQCGDDILNTSYKYASMGFFPLDGTAHLYPSDTSSGQVGWVSDEVCNISKIFTSPPTLTAYFDTFEVGTVTIAGDSARVEYPQAYRVEFYLSSVLQGAVNVSGNTSVVSSVSTPAGVGDVDEVRLLVAQWSLGNATAKIAEFSVNGVSATFTGEDIQSLSLLEESDTDESTLPEGNISANEIDVQLNNIELADGTEDPFFSDNPNSPYAPFILPNRVLYPTVTINDETFPLGTFWATGWEFDEATGSVLVTARDRMELFRNLEYSQSTVQYQTTALTMLDDVFTAAQIEMPDLNWYVDTTIPDIDILWGWIGRVSYFEAFKLIAQATRSRVYMSRTDVLTFARAK